MVDVNDVDYMRFTIDIDPDDATKQDSNIVTAIEGDALGFLLTKYSEEIKFEIVDVQAGSGKGTARKLQIIASGKRTAT